MQGGINSFYAPQSRDDDVDSLGRIRDPPTGHALLVSGRERAARAALHRWSASIALVMHSGTYTALVIPSKYGRSYAETLLTGKAAVLMGGLHIKPTGPRNPRIY